MLKILIISIAITLTSCTTPTTPRLSVPQKPVYPALTPGEIKSLNACLTGPCVVTLELLRKLQLKDVMCRGYAAEAITVIETNNKASK